MKLYEASPRSWYKLIAEAPVPPCAPPVDVEQVFFFDHLDGMYSYCKDVNNNLIHVFAGASVEKVEDPRRP